MKLLRSFERHTQAFTQGSFLCLTKWCKINYFHKQMVFRIMACTFNFLFGSTLSQMSAVSIVFIRSRLILLGCFLQTSSCFSTQYYTLAVEKCTKALKDKNLIFSIKEKRVISNSQIKSGRFQVFFISFHLSYIPTFKLLSSLLNTLTPNTLCF